LASVSAEEFAALLRVWFGQMARVLGPGRSFYIWAGYANIGNCPPALLHDGDRRPLLRRHRPAVGGIHRAEGGPECAVQSQDY